MRGPAAPHGRHLCPAHHHRFSRRHHRRTAPHHRRSARHSRKDTRRPDDRRRPGPVPASHVEFATRPAELEGTVGRGYRGGVHRIYQDGASPARTLLRCRAKPYRVEAGLAPSWQMWEMGKYGYSTLAHFPPTVYCTVWLYVSFY